MRSTLTAAPRGIQDGQGSQRVAKVLSWPPSINQAGAALRSGAVSCTGLVETCLAHIAERNPSLNAFITLTGNEALAVAENLDQKLRAGVDLGPLHGIPIVLKDNIDTAGIRTTVGSTLFKDRVPEMDATIAARLRMAGAIILGKTNMNEFAAGLTGTNQTFGNMHNPHDLAASPGGSSGGTAIAVASGLCLGGIGSDTSGSIRIPASWTGIVGLRPTYGRVSLAGVYPRAWSLDVAGPMGMRVADVANLLTPLVGHDAADNHSVPSPTEDFFGKLDMPLYKMRIGVIEGFSFHDIDPDVGDAVTAALNIISRELDVEVRTVTLPAISQTLDMHVLMSLLLYEFRQILGTQYDRYASTPELFGPIVHADMAAACAVSQNAYEKIIARCAGLRAEVLSIFKEVDFLMTPTMPMCAPPLDAPAAEFHRGRRFNFPFSYLGLPALSLPCGSGRGNLPVGLQLVGNEFQESQMLRAAHAFENVLGTFA